MNYYKLDEQNNVVPVVSYGDWCEWKQQQPEDNRTDVGLRLKQEYIGKCLVSTVFLNIDHGCNSSVPICFETMVFDDPENHMLECDSERYATYQEAMDGHERMMAKWREKLGVPA